MNEKNRIIIRVNHFTNSVDVIKEIVLSPKESEIVSYSVGIPELVERGLIPTYNLKELTVYIRSKY